MERRFNVTGACSPQLHYMVNIQSRLEEIKQLIDAGAYFTINRARQFGKTTTLENLKDYLRNDYAVIYMDFQLLSHGDFEDEKTFANAFADMFVTSIKENAATKAALDIHQLKALDDAAAAGSISGQRKLFNQLSTLCSSASKPLVLMIDEVDSSTNNQVFLDFLAQLRGYYLARNTKPTFRSVILAGVYDVKNIRQKIRPDNEHKLNSPWNIATDFDVSMSFSKADIAGMLHDYENDHHTDMDVNEIAGLIYDYTSGYPFLVSRLCKLMDEKVTDSERFTSKTSAWSYEGVLEAVKMLLSEKNTLFESLIGKLYDYPRLKQMVYSILFGGEKVIYSPDNPSVDVAVMFGFAKNKEGTVVIANRIFEMRLYNYFLTTDDAQDTTIFKSASNHKSQFIHNGHLNMELVLQKYTEHFDNIYGDSNEEFSEDEGRRRFLLYLRPIINGVGNYYIEAETRNSRRMDIVVDYLGERSVIELKIWHGNAYNERGEKQLSDYLDYFHLHKGYMLSYNFNKNKTIGLQRIALGSKILVEAIV